MSTADLKKLQGFMKRLAHDANAEGGGAIADEHVIESTDRFEAAVHEIVLGILCHHTTLHAGYAAFKRLRANFVDLNEVRVAHVHDIVDACGDRSNALRDERGLRVQAVLRDLFDRECDLSLNTARAMKAAECRAYVLSLDGMTFSAGLRVLGLHMEHAVVALDDRALWAMQQAGVVSARTTEIQVASQLAQAIKAIDVRGSETALTIGQATRLLRELGERTHVAHAVEAEDAKAGKASASRSARSAPKAVNAKTVAVKPTSARSVKPERKRAKDT